MRQTNKKYTDQEPEYKSVREEQLAKVMQEAAKEYEAERDAARLAHVRYERKETAIRQFLLFLIFFMIANTILFRNQLGSWLSSLDQPMGVQQTQQKIGDIIGQKSSVNKITGKIQALSDDADQRNKILEQIGD